MKSFWLVLGVIAMGCQSATVTTAPSAAPTTSSTPATVLLSKLPNFRSYLSDTSDDDRYVSITEDSMDFLIVVLDAKGMVSKILRPKPAHSDIVYNVLFQPGGKLVATNDSYELHLWDRSGKHLFKLAVGTATKDSNSSAQNLAWSRKGSIIYARDYVQDNVYAFVVSPGPKLVFAGTYTAPGAQSVKAIQASLTNSRAIEIHLGDRSVMEWEPGYPAKEVVKPSARAVFEAPVGKGDRMTLESDGTLRFAAKGAGKIALGQIDEGAIFHLSGPMTDRVGLRDNHKMWIIDPIGGKLERTFDLPDTGSTAVLGKSSGNVFMIDWGKKELLRLTP